MRTHSVLIGLLLVLGAGCGGDGSVPSSTVAAPTAPTASPGTGALPVSALVTIAESSTIEQQGAGQTATSNNYVGQSIRIPGGGSYNNLRFSWDGYTSASPIEPATRGPVAVGNLFILSQEYLGLPGDLPAAPGVLARSERNEQGQYVFAPSVTLKGGTTYWFYMYYAPGSARFSPVTGFSEDTYAGGDMYIAPELNGFTPLAFRKAAASWRVISFGPPIVYYIPPPGTYVDANFKLMGAPIS